MRRRGVEAVAAVAVGGALGALARYAVELALPWRPTGVPWATLLINVVGSVLVGAVVVVLVEGMTAPHPLLRPFLTVGVLGGFTTMSSLAVETVRLADAGAAARAGGYLAVSLVLGLLAVRTGVVGARLLVVDRRHPRREDGRP